MKKQIAFILIILSFFSYAEDVILNCKVTTVYNSNVFEEGLSIYEYPDLYITKEGDNYSIDIGVMQAFSSKQGDSIKVTNKDYKEQIFNFHRKDRSSFSLRLTTHNTYYYHETLEEEVEEKHAVLIYTDKYENAINMPLASFKCDK